MTQKINISPINGKVLDVNSFIIKNNIQEITSHMIYEPNSTSFHPNGLFSEKIFGSIMSEERYYNFGYISLNTDIIQPLIYDILKHLKSTYIKILEGFVYVKIDSKTNRFVIVDKDDEDAQTGYNFFVENIYKITLDPVMSDIKQGYLDTFNKYQKLNLLTCDKLIVIPSGLREIIENTKSLSKDDVNNNYMSILSISQSLPIEKTNNNIYNTIRITIQKKIFEIYNYFFHLFDGKRGYMQDKLGNRQVTFGTRNVLSIDIKDSSSPDDPKNLKPHEVKISLYQAVTAFQPFIIKFLKDFFEKYIPPDSVTATVLDESTFMPKYVAISNLEKDKFINIEKIENFINKMKYKSFKENPILISDTNKKQHPIAFVYKDNRNVYFSNNKDELFSYLKKPIIEERISLLTWSELIYNILCKHIVEKKYGYITRYPVIQSESIKPLLIKVATTIKTEKKFFKDIYTHETILAPEYPIIGEKYVETIAVNQLVHAGFGSDVDGDMMSMIGIWSNDGNKELKNFNSNLESILDNNYEFQLTEDDTSSLVIKNLSI